MKITRSDVLLMKNRALDKVNLLYNDKKITSAEANELDELIVSMHAAFDRVYCNALEFAQELEKPVLTDIAVDSTLKQYNKAIANILRKFIGAPHE